MADFKHSYENENEVVITKEVFKDWCEHVNGNKASMYSGVPGQIEKPFYHLNTATGTKTQITKYEFTYNPHEFDEVHGNRSATAKYFAKDGHVIIEHCLIG